ncbi:N-acetyl-gamma-glutamyl-phosphate reductase [Chondromyces apiculatus]|uniref:N-acetyl-gamma-glutamyl-phosphate reductase n=1 Tax=Chondromyces apiculatus DSM 436 TaxID=1192034 RepID=A0A017T012_9BACT|nr:N-acetyl-gamma-glutamyl-phosphate reductase [Chondromyces apiculatus]EYF02554.1 N-acetyl-gamma-glutamyl-phosphate reductase [Chondromyces apiculatus DSM 436]
MKRFKASIIGGSGYGAAELIRRILIHPEVELVRVSSIDYIGEPLSAVHPHLEGRTDLRFEKLEPEDAAAGCDVVLLGLPHKVAANVVPRLLEKTQAKIVDLSGDFRLRDLAAYEQYYGGKHPAPDLLKGAAVYGLPELNRDAIRSARLVASPGCFATTIILGLLPLAKAGLLEGAVETVGITGSSGSGITPTATTHHPVRAQNLRTYKPLSHQHMPEISETLTAAGAKSFGIHFVPVSAPLTRGIFSTSFARVDASVTPERLAEAYAAAFEGERFVRRPKKRLPEVAAVSGSNYAEVGFELGPVEEGHRTVACFSAIDNLIKGGAGQGIQSMNLVLGLDEGLTLEDPGGYP